MAARPQQLLQHIRRFASGPDQAPDGELLARYALLRDEDAFAELVRRHGPMVLAVCRRVLGDAHDAEDAFQATFLVLARKADSVRNPEALAAWLHGVARHLSLKCRRAEDRRRRHESGEGRVAPGAPRQDPLDELTARELLLVLDEELQRLPKSYRLPLILCGLEGLGLEEAARRLGWSPGSVKGRLLRGRKRLHDRLSRRGLALLAALLALLPEGGAVLAAVPADLIRATVEAAGAGHGGDPGTGLSAEMAALVEGTLKSGAMTKLKVALGVLLLTGAIAAGAGMLAQSQPAVQQTEPLAAAKASEPPPSKEQPRTDLHGDPLPPGAIARIGTVRFRDGEAIFALAYSPDGKVLASATGSGEGVIRLWDAATGKERLLLQPHTYHIYSLAFSPDGKMLACIGATKGSPHAPVQIWDVTTGKLLQSFRPLLGWTVAFSPDGRRLAAGGADNMVHLWDIASGKEALRFKGHEGMIWSFAFSPDGKALATASYDNTIRLWDAATGKELRRLTGPKLPPNTFLSPSVAFSPDGKVLARGGPGGTVHLWDAAGGRVRLTFAGHDRWRKARDFTPDGPSVVAFSPDGKTLAAGNEGVILDAATGKEQCRLQGYHRWIRCLVFSPDGKTLTGEDTYRIRFWDPATGEEIFKDAAHRAPVCSLAFAPDGKTLVTASYDDSAGLWDVVTGRERFRFQGGVEAEVHDNEVALSPDGRTMAAWLGDGLYSWDVGRPKPFRECSAGAGNDYRRGVAFSPRGRLLAAVWKHEDKRIRLWAEGTAKEPRLLKVHERGSNGFAFSPDGKTLASGSPGGTAGLWDMATGEELRTIEGFKRAQDASDKSSYVAVFSLAFSPDGRTLALGGSDGSIGLWDKAAGKELRRLVGTQQFVNALAYSPDGRTLAAGYDSGIIGFWEVATGKIRREWRAHTHWVSSLAFSADGKLLASAGSDTTVLIWPAIGAPPDGRPKTRDWMAKDLGAAWADLAGDDAVQAYQALAVLHAASRHTVPFLKTRLRPAPAVDAKHLARLIADLDDERFEVREKATAELAKWGGGAEPALRKALAGRPSLEVRRRIQAQLEELNRSLSGEQLREARAVEVLEQIGTPSAHELLRALAEGAPGARLTRETGAALERLARRPAAMP
jgi:RNA polymerase sigma factor (sigma-70 family)